MKREVDMIDLSGKHVLVAGGSWGIGAAAKMAARAGVCVSVNYQKNADAAAAVVGEIEAAGGRGWAVQADVAEDGALDRAVDEAVGRLGPLRGMVVSAGVFEGGA
jgi:3-oxoacyl-[acyl-carrier protein] reductase